MKINKEDCEITIDSKVGVSVLKMPSHHFTDEDKTLFAYFAKKLEEIEKGESTTLIIPSDTDSDGNPFYEFIQPNVVFQFPSITRVEIVGDIMVGVADDEWRKLLH